MNPSQQIVSCSVSLDLVYEWVCAFEQQGGTADLLRQSIDNAGTMLRIIDAITAEPSGTPTDSVRRGVHKSANSAGPFTVPEVAARLRVAVSTVYALVDSGKLHAFRIGPNEGAIRVSEQQFQDYLDACSSVSL